MNAERPLYKKNASYDNDKLFHTDSACSFTLFSHGHPSQISLSNDLFTPF